MTTINAESVRLATDADTDYEDARDWYDSYGWHLSTEHEGDVTIGAVDYDWLDGDDEDNESVVAKLRENHSALTDDEAESIVEQARTVRDAAETVEGLLANAVVRYEARDLAGVVEALQRAEMKEDEHGDSPATNALAAELLEDDDGDY